MRGVKLALVSLLFAASVVTVRAGSGDEWTVVQATGPMWVQSGNDLQRISLSDGATVAPGSTLSTGPSGRVLLKRGKETMIIGPDTTMGLPANSDRFYTTVIQITGAIEFDVDKRNVTHFAVKTPQLAAVVKGTHFVVRASDSGDSVSVGRGRVEVEDLSTGRKVDVLPGQSARFTANGLELTNTGQRAEADTNTGVANADSTNNDGLSLSISPGDGVSIGLGGDNGVSVGLGGGDGASASVGGPSGVSIGASAGSGVSASVGGSGGVGVSVGGGSGIGVGIGGFSVGIGGP